MQEMNEFVGIPGTRRSTGIFSHKTDRHRPCPHGAFILMGVRADSEQHTLWTKGDRGSMQGETEKERGTGSAWGVSLLYRSSGQASPKGDIRVTPDKPVSSESGPGAFHELPR